MRLSVLWYGKVSLAVGILAEAVTSLYGMVVLMGEETLELVF
jgi:hypothetical protein